MTVFTLNQKFSAVIALIVILALVNWSIINKETHIKTGTIIYIELAPVDPRSLIQGDYMALRFEIANQINKQTLLRNKSNRDNNKYAEKYVIVDLDENNIATFKALYTGQSLSKNNLRLRYRIREGKLIFATDAYFFNEGKAHVYQQARYGQFRVDKKGELILVKMTDSELNLL